MRRVAAILLSIGFLAFVDADANAVSCPEGLATRDRLGNAVCVRLHDRSPNGIATSGSRSTAPAYPYSVRWATLRTDPEAGRCILRYERGLLEPPDPAAAMIIETNVLQWLLSGLSYCPGAEPMLSPQEVASEVVRRVPLPGPAPRIEPGRMLVGLRAYLESNQQLVHTYVEDTPLGPISITARAVLHVDWGDGTVTGPHHDPGGPYPDGTITHVYRDPGEYTITVTATWTAEWAVAGATGVIDAGLATVGTIDGFPVEERQAVITTSRP
jgi:hypothetical protein